MKHRSHAETSDFLELARARKKQADEADEQQLQRELSDLRFLALVDDYEVYAESVRRHESRIDATERQFVLFTSRSFMARVRWFFRGR